jgi:hypothetical protein
MQRSLNRVIFGPHIQHDLGSGIRQRIVGHRSRLARAA